MTNLDKIIDDLKNRKDKPIEISHVLGDVERMAAVIERVHGNINFDKHGDTATCLVLDYICTKSDNCKTCFNKQFDGLMDEVAE